MKSKASIKNVGLHAPPLPATKPVKTDFVYTTDGISVKKRADLSPYRDIPKKTPTTENIKHSQESRMRNAAENKKIVLEMARAGATDAQIAAKTYYKESSVRRIVTALRREGYDIPERRTRK